MRWSCLVARWHETSCCHWHGCRIDTCRYWLRRSHFLPLFHDASWPWDAWDGSSRAASGSSVTAPHSESCPCLRLHVELS